MGNSAHIETNVQPTERGVPDLATLASTPHVCSTNRFAPLASMTDDEATMSGYETVQTKKNKRRRSRESQERATTTAQNPQQRQQQRQRRLALFGKSTVVTNIAAARRLRKKKVYCIDNVDPACSTDDIEAIVNAIPVDIVSCFEAKPRRRRNESEEIPRKAFRLCIYEDERERLLDASIWPDSVIISEWFFKPEQSTQRGERQEQSKKMRLGDVKNGSAAVDAAAIIVTGQSSSSSDCPTVGESNAIIVVSDLAMTPLLLLIRSIWTVLTGLTIGTEVKAEHLKIISYNMHGFMQGYPVLEDFMNDDNKPDVFLVQEHWLTPVNLSRLDKYFPDYFSFGCSAMTKCVESGMLRGVRLVAS